MAVRVLLCVALCLAVATAIETVEILDNPDVPIMMEVGEQAHLSLEDASSINMKDLQESCHTDYYTNKDGDDLTTAFIARRGCTFKSKEIKCVHKKDTAKKNWCSHKGGKTTIAGDAPAGSYDISSGGRTLNIKFIVFFNPWLKGSEEFIEKDAVRWENVVNPIGAVWKGTAEDPYWEPISYDGGNEYVWSAMEFLLSKMSIDELRHPYKCVRRLAGFCSQLILQGKWGDKGYEDADQAPWEWADVVDIFRVWHNVQFKRQVKYGQCMVFGILLTTVGRSVGLGSRPVTGYDFVTERGNDLKVIFYFDKDGNWLDQKNKRSGESQWNFHVWTEIWLNRKDLGAVGWNIADGTWKAGPCLCDNFKKGKLKSHIDCNKYEMSVNSAVLYCSESSSGKYDDCSLGTTPADSILTTLLDSTECEREMGEQNGEPSYTAICYDQRVNSYKDKENPRGPEGLESMITGFVEEQATVEVEFLDRPSKKKLTRKTSGIKQKMRVDGKKPSQKKSQTPSLTQSNVVPKSTKLPQSVQQRLAKQTGSGQKVMGSRVRKSPDGQKQGKCNGLEWAIKAPSRVKLGGGGVFTFTLQGAKVTKAHIRVYAKTYNFRRLGLIKKTVDAKMEVKIGKEDWVRMRDVGHLDELASFEVDFFAEYEHKGKKLHLMKTRTVDVRPNKPKLACQSGLTAGSVAQCTAAYSNPYPFPLKIDVSATAVAQGYDREAGKKRRVTIPAGGSKTVKFPHKLKKAGKVWIVVSINSAHLRGVRGQIEVNVAESGRKTKPSLATRGRVWWRKMEGKLKTFQSKALGGIKKAGNFVRNLFKRKRKQKNSVQPSSKPSQKPSSQKPSSQKTQQSNSKPAQKKKTKKTGHVSNKELKDQKKKLKKIA